MIDLSYAAASALDIVGAGTARVEVRALDGPPPTQRRRDVAAIEVRLRLGGRAGRADRTAASAAVTPESRPTPARGAAAAAEPTQPERLFAQAGKFTKRDDAVQLVDRLKAQGFVNAFVVTEDGRRKSLHRVRVGPLLDAAEVERMSDRLRGLGAKRSRSVVMP